MNRCGTAVWRPQNTECVPGVVEEADQVSRTVEGEGVVLGLVWYLQTAWLFETWGPVFQKWCSICLGFSNGASCWVGKHRIVSEFIYLALSFCRRQCCRWTQTGLSESDYLQEKILQQTLFHLGSTNNNPANIGLPQKIPPHKPRFHKHARFSCTEGEEGKFQSRILNIAKSTRWETDWTNDVRCRMKVFPVFNMQWSQMMMRRCTHYLQVCWSEGWECQKDCIPANRGLVNMHTTQTQGEIERKGLKSGNRLEDHDNVSVCQPVS